MCAATRNIIIEQGATWTDTLTWKTGDLATPVDLTGYTGRMQIRATKDSVTPISDITPVLGAATGTITCSLTADQTAALDFTGAPDGYVNSDMDANGKPITASGPCAVYDLELTQGANVLRLVQGLVCLSRRVTR